MCCSCGLAVCSSVCVCVGLNSLGGNSVHLCLTPVGVCVCNRLCFCVCCLRQQVNKQYRLNEQWLASTWSQKATACSVTSRVLARTDCTLTELEPQSSCESVWHRSAKLYLKSWSQRGRSRCEVVQRHAVSWFYWRIDFHQEKETQGCSSSSSNFPLRSTWFTWEVKPRAKITPTHSPLLIKGYCISAPLISGLFGLFPGCSHCQASTIAECRLHRVTEKDGMSLPSLSFTECIQPKPNNKVIVSDYY